MKRSTEGEKRSWVATAQRRMARMHASRRSGRERGAILVEFILVAPLMLLLVFGMIDFSFAINRNTLINNAAREGAREGAFNPTQGDIEAKVLAALNDLDPAAITINVSCEESGGGSCPLDGTAEAGGVVTVEVEYDHDFVTFAPTTVGMGGSTTISGFAQMRIE